MIHNPVIYNDENMKKKVSEYNDLGEDQQVGTYWNNQDDDELKVVKKYIKDHYIVTQDYTCPYCLQRIVVDHNVIWDAEHIIPKDSHPKFLLEPENLCVSCKDCNQEKSNKNVLVNQSRKTFPNQSGDYIFVHPHFDDYSQHIKVLNSSLFFIPKDAKGVKTIEICGLLRFAYDYTNYGNINLEIKKKIGAFQMELMGTDDPLVENFLLSTIEDIAKEGRKLATESLLKSRVV